MFEQHRQRLSPVRKGTDQHHEPAKFDKGDGLVKTPSLCGIVDTAGAVCGYEIADERIEVLQRAEPRKTEKAQMRGEMSDIEQRVVLTEFVQIEADDSITGDDEMFGRKIAVCRTGLPVRVRLAALLD